MATYGYAANVPCRCGRRLCPDVVRGDRMDDEGQGLLWQGVPARLLLLEFGYDYCCSTVTPKALRISRIRTARRGGRDHR